MTMFRNETISYTIYLGKQIIALSTLYAALLLIKQDINHLVHNSEGKVCTTKEGEMVSI